MGTPPELGLHTVPIALTKCKIGSQRTRELKVLLEGNQKLCREDKTHT